MVAFIKKAGHVHTSQTFDTNMKCCIGGDESTANFTEHELLLFYTTRKRILMAAKKHLGLKRLYYDLSILTTRQANHSDGNLLGQIVHSDNCRYHKPGTDLYFQV